MTDQTVVVKEEQIIEEHCATTICEEVFCVKGVPEPRLTGTNDANEPRQFLGGSILWWVSGAFCMYRSHSPTSSPLL